MSETPLSTPQDSADAMKAIASALSHGDAALAIALLQAFEMGSALVSIKEQSTGRYVYANARMAQLMGHTPTTLVGLSDAELMTPTQAGAIRSAEKNAIDQAAPLFSEHRLDREGRKFDFNVLRIAIGEQGHAAPRHVLAVWTDMTPVRDTALQLKQALAQLEQRQVSDETARRETQDSALRDSATGLYQKAHFDDQLRREVDLSSREHREFALVWIALDPFTDEVKAFGDEARTRVLESLGQLLRSNTRAMDASCRLDDDRFAVLLSGVGLATAHSRMEGLRRQCATQIVVLGGHDLGFTVSMGVASFPHTAHSEDELMNAAELALREAKRRGGNHVTLASIRFELGSA